MGKKQIRWLYDELPGLIETGVLSSESAEKLRGHYGDRPAGAGRKIAVTICSILGSLLIGTGIVLLLAYNWKGMSRVTRTILSIAPLLGAQALGAWAIYKDKTSAAWREGVGIFQTFAIAAGIALVGQTYHIPGDLGNFLLVWMILTIPLVYLLHSTLPAIIYSVAITSWGCFMVNDHRPNLMLWPLLALVIPHLVFELKKNRYSARCVSLGWILCLCLPVAVGVTVGEEILESFWPVLFGSLFAIYYLVGSCWFKDARSVFSNPYKSLGCVSVCFFAWLLTFEDVWRHGVDGFGSSGWVEGLVGYTILLVPAIGALTLLGLTIKRGDKSRILYAILPVVVMAGVMLSAIDGGLAMILLNLYTLALGVGTIVSGIRGSRLGMINGGMLVVIALIVTRFFDCDVSLVGRGIFFIVLGIGFLTTNLVLAKRMKGGAE